MRSAPLEVRPIDAAYIITCTARTATITHRNTITTSVDGNSGGPMGDGAQVAYLEQDWNDADAANNVAWFEKTYASDMTNVSRRTGKFTNKNKD